MSDEQQKRLDRIVQWMYTVSDPWMRDGTNAQPQVGSALAHDDSEGPATSPLPHRGIVMALDHLGAVVDAMVRDRPTRLKAHFTVLRTALECGTRVCWLLEPDASDERRRRAIQYRFENLEEQRKALADLSGTHLAGESGEAIGNVLTWVDTEKAELTRMAAQLGAAKLTKPPDTLSILKKMVDLSTAGGASFIQLWRTGSASVHRHYWADDMRENPAQFDHVWFQPALQGTVLMINDAMNLHHRRSGR